MTESRTNTGGEARDECGNSLDGGGLHFSTNTAFGLVSRNAMLSDNQRSPEIPLSNYG